MTEHTQSPHANSHLECRHVTNPFFGIICIHCRSGGNEVSISDNDRIAGWVGACLPRSSHRSCSCPAGDLANPDKNIRILTLVIGMIGLLSHAAAETPDEQRARCNAYAERAVAQYNAAAAHPQCHINVDFVWQPSREFHVAACMKVSRTVAEQTATTRDNVLHVAIAAGANAVVRGGHLSVPGLTGRAQVARRQEWERGANLSDRVATATK